MQLKFNENWEGGVEIPPFKMDNVSAVKLLRAILDSAVETCIHNYFSLSEAVAVQISQLVLSAKDARGERAFEPHAGLTAVYILLASIYYKQRVPAPCANALKRLANFVTRNGEGKGSVQKRAGGLLKAFRVSINQRRYDPHCRA
eukprot:4466120-Pleurochrysis_carterae.AAC.2